MTNFEKIKNELENLEETYPICYIAVHKLGLSRNDGECDDTCCQKCEKEAFKWLLEEYKEPILTEEGKAYLSNLLKPYGLSAHAFAFYFSKSINSKEIYWLNIVDGEHYPIITIKVNKNSELDKLFKNIELSKKYTLEELGL